MDTQPLQDRKVAYLMLRFTLGLSILMPAWFACPISPPLLTEW